MFIIVCNNNNAMFSVVGVCIQVVVPTLNDCCNRREGNLNHFILLVYSDIPRGSHLFLTQASNGSKKEFF